MGKPSRSFLLCLQTVATRKGPESPGEGMWEQHLALVWPGPPHAYGGVRWDPGGLRQAPEGSQEWQQTLLVPQASTANLGGDIREPRYLAMRTRPEKCSACDLSGVLTPERPGAEPEGTAARTPRLRRAVTAVRVPAAPERHEAHLAVRIHSGRGHSPVGWTWCRGCRGR